MVQSVVLRVREQSRGPIGVLLLIWATIQSVSWMGMLQNLALTPRWWPLWIGSNLVFGILIGVRRRMGTIFSGPLFATLMNVVPTVVGFQLALNHGILWGLTGATLYYLLFGWLVYGAVQVALLIVGAWSWPTAQRPVSAHIQRRDHRTGRSDYLVATDW